MITIRLELDESMVLALMLTQILSTSKDDINVVRRILDKLEKAQVNEILKNFKGDE